MMRCGISNETPKARPSVGYGVKRGAPGTVRKTVALRVGLSRRHVNAFLGLDLGPSPAIHETRAHEQPGLGPALKLGTLGAVLDKDAPLGQLPAQLVGSGPITGLSGRFAFPGQCQNVIRPGLSLGPLPEQSEHPPEPVHGR